MKKEEFTLPGHRVRVYRGATFCRDETGRRHYTYHWPIFFPFQRAAKHLARHINSGAWTSER